MASARVSPMIPAFDAEYGVERGAPITPAMEEMLMIRPQRRRRMTGTAARHISQVPRRLMRITSSNTSIGIPSITSRSSPCGAAALLTRMSSRPKCSSAVSTIASASAASPMSPSAEAARPPAPSISDTSVWSPPHDAGCSLPTTSCRRFGTPVEARSVTTTAAPSAASARAIAWPPPSGLPHPVINATRSLTSPSPSRE